MSFEIPCLMPPQHLLMISSSCPGLAPRSLTPASTASGLRRGHHEKQKRPGDKRHRQGIVARSGSRLDSREITKAGALAPASWPIYLRDFFLGCFYHTPLGVVNQESHECDRKSPSPTRPRSQPQTRAVLAVFARISRLDGGLEDTGGVPLTFGSTFQNSGA